MSRRIMEATIFSAKFLPFLTLFMILLCFLHVLDYTSATINSSVHGPSHGGSRVNGYYESSPSPTPEYAPPPLPPARPKRSTPPPMPPPPPPKPNCPPPRHPKPQCPPPRHPKPQCPPPRHPKPQCPPPPELGFESARIELVYPVIQRFKEKITYDPQDITKTWVGTDICRTYKGFICDLVPDLNVTALAGVDFNGYNFDGPDLRIEGFIEQLQDIAFFHANSNNFTGTIPAKIAELRYLYELDMSNNKLIGEFPMAVLGAKNLTFLDLRFNSFTGSIPPQVFILDLDVLFLNNNNFTQMLPDNLGSTPALYLTLANNKFTGPIPRSIANASKNLIEVLFINNQLSGCLPYEVGFLNQTTVFDVGENQLTGPIPYSFGCLEKMQLLNFTQNQLYGEVPEVICTLPYLANLSLSGNYFTQVGPWCRKLIDTKVLDIRNNCIPDLPAQRSVVECIMFFSRPLTACPSQKNSCYAPCNLHSFPQETSPHPSKPTVAPSPSYSALIKHHF